MQHYFAMHRAMDRYCHEILNRWYLMQLPTAIFGIHTRLISTQLHQASLKYGTREKDIHTTESKFGPSVSISRRRKRIVDEFPMGLISPLLVEHGASYSEAHFSSASNFFRTNAIIGIYTHKNIYKTDGAALYQKSGLVGRYVPLALLAPWTKPVTVLSAKDSDADAVIVKLGRKPTPILSFWILSTFVQSCFLFPIIRSNQLIHLNLSALLCFTLSIPLPQNFIQHYWSTGSYVQ